MKKVLAMAAVAALAAGASVYAANPFSDVSTSDWAYQAVSDLSDQGVVEGYPDGTFKGQNNITRYEMAQIIARLLAKEDQLNAEQRATLDKLAGEYADELDTLGVRVSNLEKKVGNVSWSGDARMRYRTIGAKAVDQYQGRIRLNVKGQVNDNTTVNGRLTTGDVDLQNNGDSDVAMDRLFVVHDFGAAAVKLGRYELDMGTQVSWLSAGAFDGAELSGKLGDNVTLAVGYGRYKDAAAVTGTYKKAAVHTLNSEFNKAEAFYAQAKANLGFAKLGLDYYKTSDYAWSDTFVGTDNKVHTYENGTEKAELFGANLVVPVGDFRVFGDYYKDTGVENDPTIWAAGLGYGKLDLNKAGSFQLDVARYDVEAGLFHNGTQGWQLGTDLLNQDGTFFLATGDVALAKNTSLHVEYAFGYDADHADEGDQDDQWTASLNYKF